MQSFLNKVGKTATDVASKAGNKASEMIEIGKLKSKISSKKQDSGIAKKEIGNYCYELFEQGRIDDEFIIARCEKIRANNDDIADLEKQIQIAKDEYNIKDEDVPTAE